MFFSRKYPKCFSYDVEFYELQNLNGKFYKHGEINGFSGTAIIKVEKSAELNEDPLVNSLAKHEDIFIIFNFDKGEQFEYTIFYDNGRAAYKFEKGASHITIYNYNGEEISYSEVKEGKLHGEKRVYIYANLRQHPKLSGVENYHNGEKHGLCKSVNAYLTHESTYKNGTCLSFRQFEEDTPINGVREVRRNKNAYETFLSRRAHYDDGRLTNQVSYNEDGPVWSITYYDSSGSTGLYLIFDENGCITHESCNSPPELVQDIDRRALDNDIRQELCAEK